MYLLFLKFYLVMIQSYNLACFPSID